MNKSSKAKNAISATSTGLIIKTLLPKIRDNTLRAALEQQGCWDITTVDNAVFNLKNVKRSNTITGLNKQRKQWESEQ